MDSRLVESADANTASSVSSRPLALLWVATAVAVSLHNVEEWLFDMTGWIAKHPWLPGRTLHGDHGQFTLVLAIVTIVVLVIAVTAVVARPRWSAEVLVCVAYALVVNAVSHVLLSLLSASVMPGVVSGVTVLLPVGALATRALPPAQWTASTISLTITAAVGITAGAFALAALLIGIS